MKLGRILHNWHVKVICLVIAMVLVFFTRANSLKEEPVVVFLEKVTNENFTFTETLPTRVTIMLKGEEAEIKKVPVDDLVAYVDISRIDSDGIYQLPIQIKQDRVLNITNQVEITVSPVTITTKIEEKVTKYLRVESVITGIPNHGFELDSHFVNPRVIPVTGPKTHLEGLEIIKTEPIDVSGKDKDFTTRVQLSSTDTLLSFPEGDFVEFQGIVSETNVAKIVENVNIGVQGLRDDLEIVSQLPQLTISVEGNLLSLQNFTKNNIALTINLENITEPGVYDIPVSYWTPKYAHVFNKSKDSISVTIDKKRISEE